MEKIIFSKIIKTIKKEKQIFFAAVFLLLAFLINFIIYSDKKITSDDCRSGNCLREEKIEPSLSAERSRYYADDIFKDQSEGFYRLRFEGLTEELEKIKIALNSYSEEEEMLGEIEFMPGKISRNYEMVFFYPGKFTNLSFIKENLGKGGDIFIKNVRISKLNAKNASEAQLMKTVYGRTEIDSVSESQNESRNVFPWLKEKKTVFGQIFKASSEIISGVTMDFDVNKDFDLGSRQYELSLRKVIYGDDKAYFEGSEISSLGFSIESIDKYRKKDGKLFFPLNGFLEKDAYYFIGLDNSKVNVEGNNFIEPKGSFKDDAYKNGSVAIKKGKDLILVKGDLYFNIHSPKFVFEKDIKILNGATIEDLGMGKGKYSYESQGNYLDFFDLHLASSGTMFSSENKTIISPAKEDSNFVYKIETMFPFSKINFSASQLKPEWKKISASYSFDEKNWIDIPYSEKDQLVYETEELGYDDLDKGDDFQDNEKGGELVDDFEDEPDRKGQFFNFDIMVKNKKTDKIFFRITYDKEDKSKSRNFSIKDMHITADLIIK